MKRMWWRPPGRWGRIPDAAFDVGLAAVFLAGMLVERAATLSAAEDRLVPALALSVVVAGGLALRRRAPVTGYVTGSLAMLTEALVVTPDPLLPYANFIGIYSLGLYASGRRVWCGPPLVVAGVSGYFAVVGSSVAPAAGVMFSWLMAWALGYSTARRREEQLVSQRLARRQTIVEERARIARELHDLVGHTVNLMLVQAGAARRVLDSDPERARELMTLVETVGRDALGELDRVLGILRLDDAAGSDPADEPGLPHLPSLVRRMGDAGIRVDVEVDGDLATVSQSVSLSVYRIIQEALTNALKHGGAASARVGLRLSAAALDVEIHDDGRGAAEGYTSGRGLLGIRERVALFGGSVEYGGGEGSGFRVRAVLPLP